MARKFYTIFILPHTHARFKKIHFSRNFVLVLCALLGVVLAAGLASPHLLFRLRAQSERIELLTEENQRLAQEKNRFETSLSELGERLNNYEGQVTRLGEALGLEKVPALEPAAGGGGEPAGQGVQQMLDEEMEALEVRAASLDTSFQELTGAWERRERLLASTPNMLPVRGWFSDGFGWRKDPITGRREFHKGLDIVAPAGAVVRAPADGVVIRAGRKAGYGRMVEISHGYGYATRYGHMSELLVEAGERVRRGDPLGRVGSTGRSTGPHLHYEIFREGRRVSPWKYLGDRR